MAQRRMLSLKVIDTDEFLEMPPTTQNLYFHLCLRADDDGFVASPRKIIKIINSAPDDMKVLTAKQFVIPFESGVCVIKHWRVHNLIRHDRYTETEYKKEKSLLLEQDNKYKLNNGIQNVIPDGNQMAPQVRVGKERVGEVKKGEDRLDKTCNAKALQSEPIKKKLTKEELSYKKGIDSLIAEFKEVNPSYERFFGNKTQRASLDRLVKQYSTEKVKQIIQSLATTNPKKFFPTITSPYELEQKLSKLAYAIKGENSQGSKVIKL